GDAGPIECDEWARDRRVTGLGNVRRATTRHHRNSLAHFGRRSVDEALSEYVVLRLTFEPLEDERRRGCRYAFSAKIGLERRSTKRVAAIALVFRRVTHR